MLTLNIPTKNGMSHMIIVEHPAETLEEFQEALHSEDFILMEEWQKHEYGYGELKRGDLLLVNHQLIGKVRIYKQQ